MIQAYRIVGEPAFGGLLIVADHASNRVPDGIDLGIAPDLLQEHVAIDIGVAGIAERMAQAPRTAAFLGNVSRLVADTNRRADDPAAIPEASDGHAIPGNVGIDRAARLAAYHHPFHEALNALLEATPPALSLVLHSFTPTMASNPQEQRPWHCAVLYDRDPRGARIAERLLAAEGLNVGDQVPYSGEVYNATIHRHFEDEGRPYLYLEVRQDLIADANGQAEWAERLTRICQRVAFEMAQ